MGRSIKNKKGQFLIASSLLMATMIILLASHLASTSLTDVHLLKDDFRQEVVQISSNFRGALAMSIAEVTRELDFKSSLVLYTNYTTLEQYPEAAEKGEEMLADWHKTILSEYAGLSLNLNITNLNFDCAWNSSETYSKASASLAFDIPSYGFFGWEQNDTAELYLQIMGLKTQGSNITFSIGFYGEDSIPVTGLKSTYIYLLYLKQSGNTTWFNEAEPSTIDVAYVGGGIYNVTFSAFNATSPPKIKMILRDPRGIVVAAIPEEGVTLENQTDTIGPATKNLIVNPNPCQTDSMFTLTATVDDTASGQNKVIASEYFVDTTGANGTGASMSASDGYYDSPIEIVRAQIQASTLTVGNHTLYVHGKDAADNWGDFKSVIVKIISTIPTMHVSDISMRLDWRWFSVRAVATVTVVDSQGRHVRGATVYGHWSGSVSGSASGQTGSNGRVSFNSDWISSWQWSRGGSFTFTVDNIVKSGWIYDPNANEETSDTIP
jgi:hypothetical protein